MEYRREIDGLRAVAIVPVLGFHAGFQAFRGGFVGVDVFFVISGYLITSLILAQHARGQFSLRWFYERRARRILPALLLMTCCCIPFALAWMIPSDFKDFSASVIAVTAFVSNVLFWQQSGYFDTAAEARPLLHTWSLGVEEQYYVLFPILLVFLWKFGRRRTALVTIALIGVSLAAAEWGSIKFPGAVFFLSPCRAWELLLGTLVALYGAGRQSIPFEAPAVKNVAGLAGVALIAYAVTSFDQGTPIPGVYALVPTVGAALIILFATPETLTGRLLGSSLFVGIGLISYSTYLWHQPLFAFVRQRGTNEPDVSLRIGLLAASFALAYVSWKYVECPFRDKGRCSRRQLIVATASCSACLAAFGVLGAVTNGFSHRYPPEDRYLAELQFRSVGHYVLKRFDQLQSKEFDPLDSRRKILIIGDSLAQDLVNALYEGGIAQDLQLSTRFIGHLCGDLFLEESAFRSQIRREDTHQCAHVGLFRDERLRALMLAADEVWFESAWQPWQAPFVPASVRNTQVLTGKPVRVFSTKNLGEFTIKELLAMKSSERILATRAATALVTETNAELRQSLPADVFVDVQQYVCRGPAERCRLFTDAGELISADGSHLTPAGATILGNGLGREPFLRALVAHDGTGTPNVSTPRATVGNAAT